MLQMSAEKVGNHIDEKRTLTSTIQATDGGLDNKDWIKLQKGKLDMSLKQKQQSKNEFTQKLYRYRA